VRRNPFLWGNVLAAESAVGWPDKILLSKSAFVLCKRVPGCAIPVPFGKRISKEVRAKNRRGSEIRYAGSEGDFGRQKAAGTGREIFAGSPGKLAAQAVLIAGTRDWFHALRLNHPE
jgi:hypothetical protein